MIKTLLACVHMPFSIYFFASLRLCVSVRLSWRGLCIALGMSSIAKSAPETQSATRQRGMWQRERDDLIRGVSGGFLFGIPLLYTMEVWWVGTYSSPVRMLAALSFAFVVVFLLNRTDGFRRSKHVSLVDAALESVEAVAIGLLCAAFVMLLVHEIDTRTPLQAVLGKIVFEGIPCSIGVALANQFLSAGQDGGQPGDGEQSEQQPDDRLHATLADIGATAIGATIVGFNIAPTDEIPMLATAISPPRLLLVVLASLLISYTIVFAAGFSGQQQRTQQRGVFQRPLSETLVSYIVALTIAMLLLWFYQRIDFGDPWRNWLENIVVLGLPATIGGAAGRLAV